MRLLAAFWERRVRAGASPAPMPAKDLNQLCQRSTQLMEAGGVAVPDLQRAAAPLIENARQACIQLKRGRTRASHLRSPDEAAGVSFACRRGAETVSFP